MRKTDFPQAKNFVTLVEAKQLAERKLEVSNQLSAIARQLENFHERCDIDGRLAVNDVRIGRIIHEENHKMISESGWVTEYDGESKSWIFAIKSL